ncbi:chemotaxis protein CheW [Natrialba aegyptia]|uniref:CheW protein n=1 Tax=Natrialba aegyptia DSM 13077 TaxID=1227491 RepID=M0B9Y8_9EURY|nr:chemotaxis protein CheW [Natrialba aegyptia]ELZ07630.1 CheW protein [Natrialba aegyptia DSM 13077]
MTDDRARRIREMRNRATSGTESDDAETASESESESESQSEAEAETETESTAPTETEPTPSGATETERETATAADAEPNPDPDTDTDTDADDAVNSSRNTDAAHAEDTSTTEPAPLDETQEDEVAVTDGDGNSAETGTGGAATETESAPADAAATTGTDTGTDTDTGDVTVNYDETETTADATVTADATATADASANANATTTELGGAIAGQSAVANLADVGSEPTVDASAMMEDTDGYGEGTAGRKNEMFEQGNTLIHSAHDDESTIQMLEFYLNENRYAIEIDRISAIVEMKDITRFPRGPEAIDGVTDLRGEITGVLDPTTMLDVERNELSDDQYIVVLERDDDKQKLGVRVTDVSQAVTYRDSQIDETGSVMDAAGDHQHDCVRGIIKKQDGDDRTTLVAWLDIDELIETID